MATQVGSEFYVNFKAEVTEGTAASGGSSTGERLRVLDSPGLTLSRGLIRSNERRADANLAKPRLGSKSVGGSFNTELSVGSFNTWLASLMRSTWVNDDAAITCDGGGTFTSFSITNQNEINLIGSGSFLTEGVKVGDVIRLSNMSTAANNTVNGRVKTVTASTITVYGTPYTNQSADTACTLTIKKKLAQGATPTNGTFTVEQHLRTIDQSKLFKGCRVVSLNLQMQPNGVVSATWGLVGMDREVLATVSSPYFTSPTEYTSIALVADDAALTYNGAQVATLTSFNITLQIATALQPVLGSTVAAGSYANLFEVTGDATAVFSDLSDDTLYDNETEFEMSAMLVEPETAPADFLHFFFGAVKLVGLSEALGGDTAMIQNRTLAITPRVAATGYDAGIGTISTSA